MWANALRFSLGLTLAAWLLSAVGGGRPAVPAPVEPVGRQRLPWGYSALTLGIADSVPGYGRVREGDRVDLLLVRDRPPGGEHRFPDLLVIERCPFCWECSRQECETITVVFPDSEVTTLMGLLNDGYVPRFVPRGRSDR
jgi:hypothetical protein